MSNQVQKKDIKVKITDDVLKGVYANQMNVINTREEFILDFVNIFPPGGIVNARIIISPGHLKRIVKTLAIALERYEEKFGEIVEAPEPKGEHVIQ
ncbi:DUF3467 domain-containing protein [Candidatus Aerophobetes bacterium]|uniref:DUF3467 domain-containing protein n=1 Tax=Aerophobetes bacterium TaxID=2030807 RepID=A0A662D3C8_UNCAE|nr:MAG: DUF3467 domain-containing protein [Candidatus Aerophobetes bacterium]